MKIKKYGTKIPNSRSEIIEYKALSADLSKRARKLGIVSEEDIDRVVHEAKKNAKKVKGRKMKSKNPERSWVHADKAALASVRKGLREAGEGKTTLVKNLDKYLARL